MRRRFLLGLLPFVPVAAMCLPVAAHAQEIGVGTWKLNLAKSRYEPANLTPKSQIVKFEAVPGGGMKITADTVDALGKSVHTEVVTMFDGRPSVVRGSLDANSTRVYQRIDSRTYEFAALVGGRVTATTRTVVAADGRTRTNTTTGQNVQGLTVISVAIYDKQ
ncbi:MAG: hypothetical protein WBD07_05890 [Vicinamibacterales bacterium]